ncbi:RICIN domain-containing protein [Massilia sp. PAMC28688]|uniref:RICIN domain-containing protein n=1 Tax=Massilia sp. PAMC28688 TaxID=2861283 RepID=UPI001C62EFE3|nr:RICIN domain-containing protein [Massilia sp. PAMC28688]QYF93205.1 RICIN domain-containing protein [Massilia sp. PAMC28688]
MRAATSIFAVILRPGAVRAGAALALAAGLSLPAPAAIAANCTADVIDGQLYTIASVESRKVLDIEAGSVQAGAPVQLWGNGGSPNQQFYVRSLGNGYWTIQGRQSAMLLDVAGQSLQEGGRIVQWPATGGSNQQWLLKKSTTGGYNVVARHSGKSLSVADSNSGSRVYQASDKASLLQRWFFNPVSGSCGGRPDGFAAQSGPDGLSTTTGGGSATPVTVGSCSALASALQSASPAVIQVAAGATIDCRTAARSQSACAISCPSYQDPGKTFYRVPVGTQTCKQLGSATDARHARTRNETTIKVASNKTLVGLSSGSRIIGASFNLGNARNVIIRNLAIEHVNPGLIEAGDGITLNQSSHVWIDHVRFSMISDGHVDIQNSKNVTLSWNRFDGLNPAVCGGKHHYTNAIADSQVTLHHNFWNKPSGRNPKLDGAATRVHLYNNYWLDVTYFAINANNGAQARIDGNFFANTVRPHWAEAGGMLDANLASNRYTGVSASDPYRHTGARALADVAMYAYRLDPVDKLPAQVGAGAGPR